MDRKRLLDWSLTGVVGVLFAAQRWVGVAGVPEDIQKWLVVVDFLPGWLPPFLLGGVLMYLWFRYRASAKRAFRTLKVIWLRMMGRVVVEMTLNEWPAEEVVTYSGHAEETAEEHDMRVTALEARERRQSSRTITLELDEPHALGVTCPKGWNTALELKVLGRYSLDVVDTRSSRSVVAGSEQTPSYMTVRSYFPAASRNIGYTLNVTAHRMLPKPLSD